jgi:hypothetical protein
MTIRKSSTSGVPFGNTASRPANPAVGQTYYNGELGYQEIYTDSGWIAAAGGNDFNVNIPGTYTSVTFNQSYAAGSYSISSKLNDSSLDIYAIDSDNSLVGYTNTSSLTTSQRFNKIVVVGGSSSDVLSFSYKTTYTTSTTNSETSAGPFLTSVTPSSAPNQNDTITLSGGNFATNVQVSFTGNGYSATPAKNIVRSSSSSLIITRPDNFPVSSSPYTVTVTNPGVSNPTGSNAHILSNSVTAGNTPVWVTASTLPNFVKGVSYSTTVQATDSDGGSSITYASVSGALPSGISFNSSTATFSGTPTANAGTPYSITIRATDSGGNFIDRSFTLSQVVPDAPTITSVTDVGTNRAYNNGAVSVAFSAPSYIGTSAITSYTVTASTGQSASGSSSPIVVGGIATGANPTFTITATNAQGTSLSSAASSSVTVTTVPQAPTIGTATRVGDTTVSLTFTANNSGGKTVTSYTTTSSPSISLSTSGSSSPVSVTGSYASGVSYTFSIAAINANGTSAFSSSSNSVTPKLPPVLSGGTLSSDATYYYRTFTGNGTLTVSQASIPVTALLVAGGGGTTYSSYEFDSTYGSYRVWSGGGGGGGVTTTSPTLPAGSYPIVVGAGGGQSSGGSNSTFNGASAIGGGTGRFNTGDNGGSGGGGGYIGASGFGSYSGGTGTSGQGFNGASGSSGSGGGGGGSGAAGGGSSGGAGTNSYSTWATATSTGSGGRYAGGGGGSNGGSGGSGGGASSGTTTGNAGSTNTGGGGGASSYTSTSYGNYPGGTGGSGLVIVRYLRSDVGG